MRAAAVAAVIGGLAVVAGPAGPSTAAAACFNFTTVGAADGVRTAVVGTGTLVNEADSAGPAAQASVNSLGQSQGFAGAPYPGAAATSATGLADVDSSQGPVYVATQYPSMKTAEQKHGALNLTATSEELRTTASAQGGGGSSPEQATGDTTSTATAGCAADGVISADATTDTQALSFAAGTLRIGRIQSEAHAKIGTDGQPQLSAALDVGRMTVAGQTVTVTEDGIQYPGGAAPVSNPLAEALSSAGVRVVYLGEETDADGLGIRAPGLLVETTQDVGAGQPTTVSYTFGRAYARSAGDAGDEPGAAGGSGGDVSGGSTGTGGDTGAGVGEAPALAATDPGSAAPSPTVADPSRPAATDIGADPVGATSLPFPVAGIYLALVVGALGILAAGTLLRLLGVRLTWI